MKKFIFIFFIVFWIVMTFIIGLMFQVSDKAGVNALLFATLLFLLFSPPLSLSPFSFCKISWEILSIKGFGKAASSPSQLISSSLITLHPDD